MLAAAERHIDNVSDDDEEKEEGTAHNIGACVINCTGTAQHKACDVYIQFCVCIKAFPACVVPPLPMNFYKKPLCTLGRNKSIIELE